jgi:beta-glucosidase-like glycosyl hydrolase
VEDGHVPAAAGELLGGEARHDRAAARVVEAERGHHQAPDYVLRALRERRVAGVILFGGNAPSAASVRALTAQLRAAARAGGGPPPIVCLDQEGGAIRTLRFAPSEVAQSSAGDARCRRGCGRCDGSARCAASA